MKVYTIKIKDWKFNIKDIEEYHLESYGIVISLTNRSVVSFPISDDEFIKFDNEYRSKI